MVELWSVEQVPIGESIAKEGSLTTFGSSKAEVLLLLSTLLSRTTGKDATADNCELNSA